MWKCGGVRLKRTARIRLSAERLHEYACQMGMPAMYNASGSWVRMAVLIRQHGIA